MISELKRIIPCHHDAKHFSPEFIFIRDTFYTTSNDKEIIDKNLVYWREHRQFQYSRFLTIFNQQLLIINWVRLN